MIELQPNEKTPLYEQLYAALADEIRTGQRAPGTPLPGRRTMAAQQGLASTPWTRPTRCLPPRVWPSRAPAAVFTCRKPTVCCTAAPAAPHRPRRLPPPSPRRCMTFPPAAWTRRFPGAQLGAHPEGAALPAARAFAARRDAGRCAAACADRGVSVKLPRCRVYPGADCGGRGH